MLKQIELFPESAVLPARYPVTDLIQVPFEWRSVDELMSMPSGDFGPDGMSDEWARSYKRSDSGYEALRQDIEDNGFMDPVYVQPPMSILGIEFPEMLRNGHHRVVAAFDLGYTHVPVTVDEDDGWETSGIETD